MISIRHALMMGLLITLLTACGGKPAQHKKYFRLAESNLMNESSEKHASTLVIKRPGALSILGGRPMVATQSDGSLVQLSHHLWLESPKVLLQDRLNQWAQQHWQTVSQNIPRGDDFSVLDSRILAFEKQQNTAHVDIEFFLYDSQNQLLFNERISATQSISESTYSDFVGAISMAVETVLSQLQSRLTDVF